MSKEGEMPDHLSGMLFSAWREECLLLEASTMLLLSFLCCVTACLLLHLRWELSRELEEKSLLCLPFSPSGGREKLGRWPHCVLVAEKNQWNDLARKRNVRKKYEESREVCSSEKKEAEMSYLNHHLCRERNENYEMTSRREEKRRERERKWREEKKRMKLC